MAIRVPTVTGPSVGEQPLPDARQSSIASPDLLGGPARQTQALGTAVEGLGGEMGAIRQQLYQQANAARVDDAVNQAQEIALRLQHDKTDGFTAQTGYAALNRDSGMPLADEYTGKLRDQVTQIAGTLSNNDQRRMFDAKVNNVVTGFYGQAMTYEAQQQKDYTLSVKDASVTNAKNALALNFSDPNNVQLQTTRIRAAIEGGQGDDGAFIPGSAQMQGKSAAWAKETADQAISDAHGNAIKAALESGNVNGALAYFNKYGGEMTAKDVLEVRGKLQTDYDTRLGATVADQVFNAARDQVMPTDYTRLTSLVRQAESGGQRYAPGGGLLTSPKGAQGEMQVMPTTAKDPGFGVTPAKDDSPGELARVGRDYLAAMIVRYKGDVPKALAAYNAGPGVVDKAIADADTEAQTGAFRGGQPGPDYWRSKLPQETQAYVASITTKYTGGATPQKPSLMELQDQVRATLGPNASPLAVKTATEQVTQRYNEADKAIAQRKDEVTARAMQVLAQNGGRYSELPAGVRTDLTQFAPDKVDDVLKFGQRVALGDDTTNPAVYLRLSDPGTLRGMSESQLYAMRTQLSDADYKHFAGERSKLLNPTGSAGPGDLNSEAIKRNLDNRLRELGIDPTPTHILGSSSTAPKLGAIRQFIDTEILAMQREAGRKFNDAETSAAIDKLAATSVPLRQWLISTKSVPLLDMDADRIPSSDQQALRTAFEKQGISDPTDAQMLGAYMHWKTHTNDKPAGPR